MQTLSAVALLLACGVAQGRPLSLPSQSPKLTKSSQHALSLRGGIDTVDLVTQTTAGLMSASGVFGYISPKKNLAAYGAAEPTVDQIAWMRYAAAVQLAGAMLVQAGHVKGAEFAASFGLSSAALCVLMSQPGFEPMGMPKESGAFWVVFLGFLGKFAREGKIDGPLAIKIATGLFFVNGAQFYLAPQSAIDMYKVKCDVTSLGKNLLKIAGGNLIAMAVYIGVSAAKDHATGLGAYLGVSSLMALKYALMDAEQDGVDKAGPLVWFGLQGALAGIVLKESM